MAEQNERLRAEVAALKEELRAVSEHRLENERLRLLVGLKEQASDVPMIAARVISTSPTPLFRAVRIDKGSRHGVQVGCAVVVHDGVVGRVAALSPFSSDVMLIVDTNSSIDVLVQRTRARARVRGEGGDHGLSLVTEHLARTEEVEPGDLLITSGAGESFPKGLAVGTVAELTRGAFGLYQHARAEPSVDLSRIEDVMVIPAGFPETASFETQGEEAP
ncbi:MAG: rod shape-determining protein MreC [Deltaproteobacteria bacterium]|nr:rod shape-determining protein MreC [Deltaproteobacteria bacterium]